VRAGVSGGGFAEVRGKVEAGDRMVKMDLRGVTIDVAKQEVMTRDNVPATVDAVIYFRVIDPVAAVIKVENF
jgi:regulator of protease activity HflC (stomatin/prohibitin superfamily)